MYVQVKAALSLFYTNLYSLYSKKVKVTYEQASSLNGLWCPVGKGGRRDCSPTASCIHCSEACREGYW